MSSNIAGETDVNDSEVKFVSMVPMVIADRSVFIKLLPLVKTEKSIPSKSVSVAPSRSVVLPLEVTAKSTPDALGSSDLVPCFWCSASIRAKNSALASMGVINVEF